MICMDQQKIKDLNLKMSAQTIKYIVDEMLATGKYTKENWRILLEVADIGYKNTKGKSSEERDHDYHVIHWKKKKVDKE